MLKVLSFLLKTITGIGLAAIIMVLIWQQAGKDPRVEAKRLAMQVGILHKKWLDEQKLLPGDSSEQANSADSERSIQETYNPVAYECPPKAAPSPQDEASSVFTWKDASGKTHFSDVRPNGQSHQTLEGIGSRREYFDLVFQEGRSALPSVVMDRIHADTYQIFDVLYRDIATVERQLVTLNLRLFANRADYLALQKTEAPNLSPAAIGFYTGRSNYAAIDASGPVELTTTVIRHESTHALVSNLFGLAPIWFNEGMAVYFEGMRVAGQLRQIDPNPYFLHVLARGKAIQFSSLEEYFSVTGEEWYAASRSDHNYAVAWSLVYHLMSDVQTKQFLGSMMSLMADNYCRQLNSVRYIEDRYPGGMAGLEREWRQRIQSQNWQSHRY